MDKEQINKLCEELNNGVNGFKKITLELAQKLEGSVDENGKYISEDVNKLFDSIKNNDIEAINELNKKYARRNNK